MLNNQQERALRSELKRGADAVALARQMTEFDRGRFAIKWAKDFFRTPLPQVQEARGVATILNYDGLLLAHDNDLAGALRDARGALNAGRAIGDEFIIVSQAVRQVCDRTAVSLIERSLACGVAPEQSLADLQKELMQESQTPFFLMGIRGHRACFDQTMQLLQNGEISFTDFRQAMNDYCTGGGFFGTPKRPPGFMLELAIASSYLNIRNERARFLELMNEIQELYKHPSWESLDRMEALYTSVIKEPGLIVSLFGPINMKFFEIELLSVASLRTAYVGLALERFRLARGSWPKSLSELVPAYLPEIPIDPFDGAPLRLLRTETGIVVYSVSLDRIDQQGKRLAKPLESGSDISFELLDPEKRRQPGKPFPDPVIPPPVTGSAK